MAQVLPPIPLIDEDEQVTAPVGADEPSSVTSGNVNGLLEKKDGPGLSCLRLEPNGTESEGTDVGATRRRNSSGTQVRRPPNTSRVEVRCSTHLREPSDKVYKMTAPKRGYCVIINNLNFEGFPLLERHGSKEEGEMLEQLFTQLGFEVNQIVDASRDRMRESFKEYSEKPDQINCDAFIGIILSHGGKDNLIHGCDNYSIEVEQLIDFFNNKNCPALVNKPKIFFVQACRGMKDDHGVQVEFVCDAVGHLSTSGDAGKETRILPTWGDTVICYSTVDGFTSNRNRDYGSWFGDALMKVFSEDSCKMELHRMLMKVNNMLMNKEGSNKLKQSLEVVYRGWAKRLYFNPGLSEI